MSLNKETETALYLIYKLQVTFFYTSWKMYFFFFKLKSILNTDLSHYKVKTIITNAENQDRKGLSSWKMTTIKSF